MQNISKEDYLSTIYKHRETDGTIKANQIAENLSVSNAAVTDMLKKLSKDGYVDYKRYQGIKLTSNGEEYAKNMVRRHRIWEVFLHQIVGIPWDKVHEEAHNLEHSASNELINRMEEMLDFPAFDPHGDPIPSKEGVLPKQKKNKPLSLLKANEKGKVVRVNDYDNGFLNYISKIGVELGKEIQIKERLEFDRSMLVAINGKELNISNTLAANIFVEEKKN
ncbi:MAG: metal-dependent transcriptional regulator [Ignavibacteria bacterium]|nr:metal-dependent transcriptional regulator [Ignavibacteria bacterium]